MIQIHRLVRDFFEDEIKELILNKGYDLDKALTQATVSFREDFSHLESVQIFDNEVKKGNLKFTRRGTRYYYTLNNKSIPIIREIIKPFIEYLAFKLTAATKPKSSSDIKKLKDLSNEELYRRLQTINRQENT